MAKSSLPSYKSKRSPAQNAIIAFVLMLCAFFCFGMLPTQWFAAKYQYDVNLGEALFRLHGFAFYLPSDWVGWGWRLADIEALQSNVHVMLIMGVASVAFSIFLGVGVSLWLARYTGGMSGLHGSAHWAEKSEIDQTGFISAPGHKSSGVVVGSVMMDSGGKIIHPYHSKFDRRYEPMMVRGSGGLIYRKVQKRNDDGRPMFSIRKSAVSKVELLLDGGNTHIFAFCPTRSGKGVGMVIPTLLTWPNSVFVNDPKGEAFALSAGFRLAAGQVVMKFEPSCTDGTSARWNPLEEIRIHSNFDVQDAQMIMSMVCDPNGGGLEDYFDKAAFEFLMGLSLHMRYAEKNGSMEGIALFLGDPNWDSDKQMYEHMKTAIHDPEGKMGWKDSNGKFTKTHPIVANTAQTMLNKEDKDRSGVLSTAKSLLSLYLDPIVAKNTSCSDFLVRDLMTGDKPVSLYYVVGPADMERMVPLTRLFYALFIRRNASDMAFADGRSAKNYTFPLLMIIDEMPSLKKLPILQEALGYVAGYGIRMFMLAQDITQIEELYGDKQAVDSGAATRIAYAPNKIETAEKLSRMTGKTTVTEEKASHSRDMIGIKSGSVSLSTDKIGRDLMTADEFMGLSYYDMVVFVAGQPAIYGRKAFYYENPVMLARAKIAPPKRSAVLRKVASEALADVIEVRESTLADKWAASRDALKEQVVKVIQKEPLIVKNGGDSDKPKSRYADKVKVLSAEELAQIQVLVKDVVLVDKFTAVSAF